MVLSLFGKKKAPEKKINQPSAQDMELERQGKLTNRQKILEEMREKIEVYYQKTDQMQTKVKKLISEKKKNEAKRQLYILKVIQEELSKQENTCIMLEKTKIAFEWPSDSLYCQLFQKQAEKSRDFFEDFSMEKTEMDKYYQKIDKLFSDNATDDGEEQFKQLYKELEQEILDEQMENINSDPLKNDIKPQVQTHTNTQTQAKQMEESSVDDLPKEDALYS